MIRKEVARGAWHAQLHEVVSQHPDPCSSWQGSGQQGTADVWQPDSCVAAEPDSMMVARAKIVVGSAR